MKVLAKTRKASLIPRTPPSCDTAPDSQLNGEFIEVTIAQWPGHAAAICASWKENGAAPAGAAPICHAL
jgi:hypothetical protein